LPKNIGMVFWKLYIPANFGLRGINYALLMKANITSNWLMKPVCGFTFEKFEKLSFQKIIPFEMGHSKNFFSESFEKQ
jgi:hypothetical protein